MIGPIDKSEIENLTPMPASVGRLAAIVSDPNAEVGDVARTIELDQALTVKVLRLANSALSGSQIEIDTVQQALVRIGSSRILQLVVGNRVGKVMQQPCDGYELAESELWRHSVAAALAAELVSKAASESVPGSAFTAALLHDIGKLLLTRHFGPQVIEAVHTVMLEDGLLFLDAERRLFKTDHAQVGSAVTKHWGFPEELVQAIEQHHDPDADPNPVLDTVHVSNLVAKMIGIGLGIEQMHLQASVEAPKRLGLRQQDLEGLCASVLDELAKAEDMYGSEDHDS